MPIVMFSKSSVAGNGPKSCSNFPRMSVEIGDREQLFEVQPIAVQIGHDHQFVGMLFVQLDEGGAWRLQLARELKAAGLDVDMNRAL